MNLHKITPQQITDKFSIWLNRWICEALRKFKQTGGDIVNRINTQDRPKNIYEVKKFIEKLEYLLPKEEGITEVDWYLKFRRDVRRWKNISEKLTVRDFIDVTLGDIVEYMIEDKDELEDLIDIVMAMDIKNG